MVRGADQNEASPALNGLRTAKLSPRSWAPGRSSRGVSHGDPRKPRRLWGVGDLRNCRHFRGLLGGPAEGCLTETTVRPRRPWGGGLRSATLSPRSWAPGRSSGGVSYADHFETSPSPGVCDLRNCRHFRGLLGGPAEWCLTQTTMKLRRPWGAAICETVATFVSFREVQRRGVLRGSQL